MNDEPKTLTPEEAFAEANKRALVVHFYENGYVEIFDDGLSVGFKAKFLPALSEALGVRVVARDEAAELRAENERLRADLFEYVLDGFAQGAHRQEDGGYHTGGISTYRDLGDWLVEHAGWTRRDGGSGRMQTYDPPASEAGQ